MTRRRNRSDVNRDNIGISSVSRRQQDDNDDRRNAKRLKIMLAKVNGAIESPATYEEALESGDTVHWTHAIRS